MCEQGSAAGWQAGTPDVSRGLFLAHFAIGPTCTVHPPAHPLAALQQQEAEAEAAWVEADARFQDVLDDLEAEQRSVNQVR